MERHFHTGYAVNSSIPLGHKEQFFYSQVPRSMIRRHVSMVATLWLFPSSGQKKIENASKNARYFSNFVPSDRCSNTFGGKCASGVISEPN